MRKSILIIVAILIVLGGAFFFFSTREPQSEAGGGLAQKALNLFPFGKNEANTPANNEETVIDTSTETPTEEETTTLAIVRQLSSQPVAGATSIIKPREIEVETSIESSAPATIDTVAPTENVAYVRYIEKGTGNIYDIAVDERQPTRITNTTIPKIFEALFVSSGERVIIRYIDNDMTTIKSWNGIITQGKINEPDRLTGAFMDDNITSLSVSPDTQSIFYVRDIGDTTYGYSSRADGTEKKQLFDSSFSEWITQWPRMDSIEVTTKASGYFEGYMYSISPATSIFKKELGPTFGLTTNSDPVGDYSLYSFTVANGLRLKLLDNTTSEQLPLPVTTFAEKCVWSKTKPEFYCAVPKRIDNHIYPDEWYRGEYFTNDVLWKVDASTGVGFFVMDLEKEAGVSFDVVSPQLTPDEDMLYFINKKDSTLWGVTL